MQSHRLNILLVAVFSLTISSKTGAQSSDTTLDIVNWNIEWFGSSEFGPVNKDLQEQNVIAVLKYLDADLYALCEVVDTIRFKRVVAALGADYDFVIADFCSFAGSMQDRDWISGQKLAFIYNRKIFSNIKARGMLRNSGGAYNNFASGRLPYLFNANIDINGSKRNINFIQLHGKSGESESDYLRRAGGAAELKDTIDAEFTGKPLIILGDFNDDLDATISKEVGTLLSSYDALIKDSTGAEPYTAVTLPLSYAGIPSTLDYPDIIDHQVVSFIMDSMYIQNAASVRMDIQNIISNYGSDNTSDHYPVFSQFHIINGDTSAEIITPPPPQPDDSLPVITVLPNPFRGYFIIKTGLQLSNVYIVLYSSDGKRVYNVRKDIIAKGETLSVNISAFAAGIYFLVVTANELEETIKVLKQ